MILCHSTLQLLIQVQNRIMRSIAIKMLLGDRAKYLGLVFGVTFATLLMAQQVSIFIGVMARTASAIYAVSEADIWVMDQRVRYIEEV